MTSPSDLPPLKQDDELGAIARWTRTSFTQAGTRLYAVMVLIAQTFQSLSNEETDPDDARTDVTFYCIDGTIQHLIVESLNARTLGQQEEQARIQSLIDQLRTFQDQLDPED